MNIWNQIKGYNEKRLKKLKGPMELPQQIGGYLVIHKAMDPDIVWSLRCVVKPREIKNQYDFRVYSPSMTGAAGMKIIDYHSLDNHPKQVLYHGWYDKYSNKAMFDQEIDHHAA